MKKGMRLFSAVLIVLVGSCKLVFSQGTIWGTQQSGGASGGGTLFKANFDGTSYQKIKDFGIDVSGNNPFSRLVAGPSPTLNDKLYATTASGGVYGAGVIFQYDPSNDHYTKVYDFNGQNGKRPMGAMALFNNKFYGVTFYGGATSSGVIFSFDPSSGTYTKEADFNSSMTGANPNGYLTLLNNKFYGTTSSGGSNNAGVLFEFDPTQSAGSNLVNKYDFPAWSLPKSELVVYGGLIYGVTSAGGVNNMGTIFEFNPAASVGSNFTKKVDFDATTGSSPNTGMTLVSSSLYGTTSVGGDNAVGTIFEYVPGASTITVKVDAPVPPFGEASMTGTMLYANNLLYGNNGYAMFTFDPSQSGTASYNTVFTYDYASMGIDAQGGFTLGSNGKMYGLTWLGGLAMAGTILKYDPSQAVNNGVNPIPVVPFDTSSGSFSPQELVSYNGKLYGHTYKGDKNRGTIFEYDPSNGALVDTGFGSLTQSYVSSAPTLANGKFYGAIGNRVYEYDPAAHTITDKQVSNGLYLQGFTLANNGLLYGLTMYGGANNSGYIAEYDPSSNTMTKKLDFESSYANSYVGEFVLASNGYLYSASNKGGANGKGYLIEYVPGSSTVTKRYDFQTGTDSYDMPGLSSCTANGKLYGIRPSGGVNSAGSIFEYTLPTNALPDGVMKEVVSFAASGANLPQGSMVESGNGKFYGLTFLGGANNYGTLFEYDPIQNIYTDKVSFDAPGGYAPGGILIVPDPQTITFNALNPQPYGSVIKPAHASSQLPIQYTSSNPNVVKAQGDSLIVVGIGTALITASQPGNGGYLAATPVQQSLTTVKADQVITFNAITDKMISGGPFTLNASASSKLEIAYSSSNLSVASISGKTVTPLSRGTTIIQATQAGSEFYNAAQAVTQTLVVVNSVPQVIHVIPNQEAFQLSPFTFTFAEDVFTDADNDLLTYTVQKVGGATLPNWLSFNPSTRTFSGTPAVTDTTATIQVTASDGMGGHASVVFKIQMRVITGIDQVPQEITLFPNPVQSLLTIDTHSEETTHVMVRSMQGSVIHQHQQNSRMQINVDAWAAGLYVIEITKGNRVVRTKLIKY
jgi:uncharacterized repeat protein (TIGR03803 family)